MHNDKSSPLLPQQGGGQTVTEQQIVDWLNSPEGQQRIGESVARSAESKAMLDAARTVSPELLIAPMSAIAAMDDEVLSVVVGCDAFRIARGVAPKYFTAVGVITALQSFLGAAVLPQVGEATFQDRVAPWMLAAFGPVIAADKIERNHRFFEESTELVQANGMTRSEAHQLVDYTFGRPIGEINQEAGGVMVTLAALCLASDLDMHDAGETELARINVPETILKIRAKQAAKPNHSPLPAATASLGEAKDPVRWDLFPGWLIDHIEGEPLTEEGLQFQLADMIDYHRENPPTDAVSNLGEAKAVAPVSGEMAYHNGRAAYECVMIDRQKNDPNKNWPLFGGLEDCEKAEWIANAATSALLWIDFTAVPWEPTPWMIACGQSCGNDVAEIYKAMLASSPNRAPVTQALPVGVERKYER